jgi:hypothetical protein
MYLEILRYYLKKIIKHKFYIYIHSVFLETPSLHTRKKRTFRYVDMSFRTRYVSHSGRAANLITWLKQKKSIITSTIAR